MFYGIRKQGGYLNRADEILREIVLPKKNKITIENFIYEHRDIILDFMSKEKEKGIEELYSYLIKNKDEISKEEYEELKKDFKNTLLKAYSEKSISKEFFEEYSQKIKELEGEGGIKKKRTEEKEIKYCPKCGAVNEKRSIFCAKCGYEFKKELKEEQPSSKKQWSLVIGLIVIVCVVAIVGEHFLEFGKENESVLKYRVISKEDYSYLGAQRMKYIVIVDVESIPSKDQLMSTATEIWQNGNKDWDEFTVQMYLPEMEIIAAYAVAQFDPEGLKDFEINEHALYGTKWDESHTTTESPITTLPPTATSKPTTLPPATKISEYSDEYYILLIKTTLQAHEIDVYSVLIPKSKVRELVVFYYSRAKTEDEMAEEIGYILGAFVGAVKNELNVERMVIFVGEKSTDAIIGSLHCETDWVKQYLRGDMSIETLCAKTLMTLKAY